MNDLLWKYSASKLAELIRNKDVTSREVVESHLARIEQVNGKLNAVTVVLKQSALDAADNADAGVPMGAFYGVPFTIKENIDCLGSATTNGLPLMADAMPTSDSPIVARMKAAGAIPLARTNLPELGLRITTDNPLRGRTLNPWSEARTSGGSSGGEGSAIASGMSPIGLGNDIGGSLRNPAYCCGITSLKPSTGRIAHALSIPPSDPGLAGHARLSRIWSLFFESYPLIIGPTWTREPFLHDADLAESGAEMTVDTLRFITPANLMGLPAVSVPTGISKGLPKGVQILADRWREDLVLDAAATIEANVGQITPIDPTF